VPARQGSPYPITQPFPRSAASRRTFARRLRFAPNVLAANSEACSSPHAETPSRRLSRGANTRQPFRRRCCRNRLPNSNRRPIGPQAVRIWQPYSHKTPGTTRDQQTSPPLPCSALARQRSFRNANDFYSGHTPPLRRFLTILTELQYFHLVDLTRHRLPYRPA